MTSSGLGGRPVAGCTVYSAAKACSSYLAQALSYELTGRVDVMSWEAGAAGTKMFPEEKRAKMYSPGRAVDGMLVDLGHERLSYGSFKHDWSLSTFKAAPTGPLMKMMNGAMTKSYHRDLERIKKDEISMDDYLKR